MAVSLIYLPPGPGGGKQGLDDFLADGHSEEELLSYASPELRQPVSGSNAGEPYRETEDGIFHQLSPEVSRRLTNFRARIVEQTVRDDGLETQRLLEVEAALGRRQVRCSLTASVFAAMGWPLEHLGGGAIVFPGNATRDHARVAIQVLSGEIPERCVFAHAGWRFLEGRWLYLHGGGAIGSEGAVDDVAVDLEEFLGPFVLPPPPEGERLREAVRASLGILDVAPDIVTVPVLCAAYRAPLGECNFSEHIVGDTGQGKTALAALIQQHFGAGFTANRLPADWIGTGNALELIAYLAKDAVLLIDDFAPNGTGMEIARAHSVVSRVLRAQGNRAGRARMRADGGLRPAKPPRALILSTGEDLPRGQSLRARVLLVNFPVHAMDWQRLTGCQSEAAGGLYAQAMSGYLRWLAERYEDIGPGGGLRREVHRLRESATQSWMHRRTPSTIADLAVGLSYFLSFAQESGALATVESDSLWGRGWRALERAAAMHSADQQAASPAGVFLRLLGAAITSGSAYLAGPDGSQPPLHALAWGWRGDGVGPPRPLGRLVGWLDGDDLYLEPESAYATANALLQAQGLSLPVEPTTLWKRLYEQGLLHSTDRSSETLKVRRVLSGERRRVLHLHVSALLDPQEPGQPGHPGGSTLQDASEVG